MRNAVILISILLLAVAGMLWLGQTPKHLSVAELESLGLIALPEPLELTSPLLFDQSGNPFDV